MHDFNTYYFSTWSWLHLETSIFHFFLTSLWQILLCAYLVFVFSPSLLEELYPGHSPTSNTGWQIGMVDGPNNFWAKEAKVGFYLAEILGKLPFSWPKETDLFVLWVCSERNDAILWVCSERNDVQVSWNIPDILPVLDRWPLDLLLEETRETLVVEATVAWFLSHAATHSPSADSVIFECLKQMQGLSLLLSFAQTRTSLAIQGNWRP